MVDKEDSMMALKVLYTAFKHFSGQDPFGICDDFNISIVRSAEIKPYVARLRRSRDGLEVWLPEHSLIERDDFATYHELAHFFLYRELPFGRGIPFKEDYWIHECWVDNFAIAMCLSKLGKLVVNEDNYADFFEQGIGLEWEQRVKSCVSILFSHRTLATKNEIKIAYIRNLIKNLIVTIPLVKEARLKEEKS